MTAHTVVGHLDTGDTRDPCVPRPHPAAHTESECTRHLTVCSSCLRVAAREDHSPQRVAYRDVRSRTID